MSEEITIVQLTEQELQEKLNNARLEGEIKAIKDKPPVPTISGGEVKNKFGFTMKALAMARGNDVEKIKAAVTSLKNVESAQADYLLNKIDKMNTGTVSAGGFMIDTEISSEIIPALRNQSVIMKAGATMMDMYGGQLIMRTEGSGSVAYWVGEGNNITKSDPSGGQVQIPAKTIAGLVVVSNQLLKFANTGNLTQEIQNDMTNAIAEKIDSTFIRSTTDTYSPKGILGLIETNNKFNANSTVNVANTYKDLGTAILKLKAANIPMRNAGWIISPRTEFYLMTLLNTNGVPVFRDEMTRGTILGYKYYVTNNIPENLSTNKSEIYFGDFAQLVVANDVNGMDLTVYPDGTYNDGSNVISGISTNETVIRAIQNIGFGIKYKKAFSVIEAVGWGA